jgi:AcrR family transcriptional regulator
VVPEESVPKRRRGRELEDALLQAVLDELAENGYADFTIERVAERAATSRHVLYRRWRSREELVLAALRWDAERDRTEVPDLGSLRDDVLAALRSANERRIGAVAIYSVQLGTYFRDTGTSLAELRRQIIGDRPPVMQTIVDRAVARGEVDPARLAPRVVTLPADLLRHEALMTLGPVSDEAIVSIVDDVFLPLVLRA